MVVCPIIIKMEKEDFYTIYIPALEKRSNDFAVISRKQTVIFYDILYRFEQLLFVKIFQL